jgi:putative membrane-bound dehydrogenase-like protein
MKQFAAVLVWSLIAFCIYAQDTPTDHPVEKVRAALRLADPSLTIECVASEPDVIDPVAVAWDEDGRMYVVEMRDYPMGPVGGTVRRLTDDDHDGTYENATVFAGDLPFPNSALAYDGGLLVTSAPDIWFLKDNDGDGVADERRVVLTGFGEGNQQLRINHLFWGLDNWIYAANGRSDGTVRRPEDAPENAVPLRRHDLRFKPDMSAIEPIAGFSQFGICQDDWGNRFLSWNTVPIRHVALEERYLTRNPHLAATSTESLMAERDLRIFPIVPKQQRFNTEVIDSWNASCGLTIYRGDAMPAYKGNAFVCESVTSLVHRMEIEAKGPTFVARRADEGVEFLASTDLWFRAVNLATGPDGALYVVDFAREWVEHPDFVPKDMRESVNWRNGDTLGRIWRIRPRDWSADGHRVPTLSDAGSFGLVPLLNHASAWYRTQAQRLLVTRNDAATVPALKEAARSASTPQGRIHALWTLEGMQALDDAALLNALKDNDAHVRRQAVLLCEPRASDPKVLDALAALAADPDAAVRFQLAATAGALPSGPRLAICREIAATDAADRWFRLALLGSINTDTLAFLNALFEQTRGGLDAYAFANFGFVNELCELVGKSGNDDDVASLLGAIARQRCVTAVPDLAMLSGLTRGLSRSAQPLRQRLGGPSASVSAETIAALGRAFESADYVAHKDGARDFLRAAAVTVLAQNPDPSGIEAVKKLLTRGDSDVVRAAALDALVNGGDRAVVASMLTDWRKLTRAAQRALVASLVRSPDSAKMLLDAVDSGTLSPLEIDAPARETLKAYPVPELKERATALFTSLSSPQKAEVIKRYMTALDLAGDKTRGGGIFATNCLPCHAVQGIGQHVGPDLSGIASKPKEQLVHSIVNPGEEISPDFLNYTISTVDLDIINGVLGGETASSITLKQAAGIEVTVLRENIEEMTVNTQSLMPEGLDAAFDVQGMADLLEFLRHPDGAILKTAAQAVVPVPKE